MALSKDMIIYWSLILIMSLCMALLIFFPWEGMMTDAEMPASREILALVNFLIGMIVYGGLGYVAHRIWKSMGLPGIYNHRFRIRDQILTPLFVGVLCGIVLILGDMFFATLHDLGRLPHPPFPASVFASVQAGIGEEILFRYFFMSVWLWIIWKKVFRENYFKRIYWVLAIISALGFAAAHLPAVTVLYGVSITELPPVFLAEIFILNGVVAMAAAYYMKKYGILAAFSVHILTDIVWHVIWGAC